ncbi:transcriptional regulator [Paraburkholderia sp. BL25I1N1]|nr:transcriptional regulator [Paraburkholderia sp. BL25I1N1]
MNLLAEHQREVLTRAFVISQVWDMSFDSGTNIVEVAIGRMRAKIDDPFERKLLHTVRGMGYVLEDRSSQVPARLFALEAGDARISTSCALGRCHLRRAYPVRIIEAFVEEIELGSPRFNKRFL